MSKSKLDQIRKVLKLEESTPHEKPDKIVWRLKDGIVHRLYGPAIEYADGSKAWYLNGRLHREDGPAIEGNQSRVWYLNGKLHRVDGPAIENADVLEWWIENNRHREDGPAVEYADGRKEWWVNGKPTASS